MSALRECMAWRGEYKGVPFEINRRPKYQEIGNFDWTFYVYFIERKCQDFGSLWLPDRVLQLSAGDRGYVSHDYMDSKLASVEWHCGITYYEKIGHTEGHRAVKAGCDYQHYWDEGHRYDLKYVEREVHEAIDSAFTLGIFAEGQP